MTDDFCILDEGCTDPYYRPEPVCGVQLKNYHRLLHHFNLHSYSIEDLVGSHPEARIQGVREVKSYRVLRIFLVWLVLFGSKFLILEVVDLVFGDHVELGKFLDVILLVIVLMIAREVFQRIYVSLGSQKPAS